MQVRLPKLNEDYNIGQAFAAIEEELIQSMIRNMKRHRVEETDMEMQWEMWQAKQLDALEKYKRNNRKKYKEQFLKINDSIEAALGKAYIEGGMEQEIEILKEIQKRYGDRMPAKFRRLKERIVEKLPFGSKIDKDYFQVNDKRLDALIHATTSDMKTAESAMLRMADDQYRKIIFNAQVYAATGAGTYEKAVDMATKDFLAAGINCIEYKDGRRVNISSYASMAIRTADKRARLYADGEVRKSLGIHTVITKKRTNACPKCLPFVDKILIDDVWSGGSKEDGPYPLLSQAMEAGFLHPNCKDHFTTYIPGVTEPPEGGFSKEEIRQAGQNAVAEADQQYAERQVQKYNRLAEYSLDEENQKLYKQKFKAWDAKAAQRFTVTDDIIAHRKDTPPRMAEMVNQYTADEFTVIDENASDAFAYDSDLDAVVVNPNHSQFENYDPASIMIHEIAHRIDFNELGSPMNAEFSTALVELSDRLLSEKEHYQSMFAPGGKLEYNELISDIIASVTHNEIRGVAYHDLNYIQQLGNKEMEVFADTFAVFYNGGDESVEFIQKELPELYQAFIKLLGE